MPTLDDKPNATGIAPDGSIRACTQCDGYLGLMAPSIKEAARCWICTRCRSAYLAAASPAMWMNGAPNARTVTYEQALSHVTMELTENQVPYQQLHELLKYLDRLPQAGSEMRKQARYTMAMPVWTLPLGDNFRVTGSAFRLSTINVSRGGASLFSEREINSPYLCVDLSDAGVGATQAILTVLRVRPLLSAYEVAGRWLARVSSTEAAESGPICRA
jgi:hypothetical protein